MPKVLEVNPAEHCKGCWLYEDKGAIAQAIGDLLTEMHQTPEGERWDFETCLQGCWKKAINRADYARKYYRERYQQKRGLR